MTTEIFTKEFSPCKRASYTIKVQSDANNEFYTCTVEWLSKSRKEQPQFINAPLEFMKELIKYMRDLFDILSKNQNLIIEKKLTPSVQLATLTVALCALNDWTIFSTISVEPTEHTSIVGMHKIEIGGTSGPTNIFFTVVTVDSLNNLEQAIDEADNKVNMLDAEVKGKRKFKKGCFIRQTDMIDLIHQQISAKCGTFM